MRRRHDRCRWLIANLISKLAVYERLRAAFTVAWAVGRLYHHLAEAACWVDANLITLIQWMEWQTM